MGSNGLGTVLVVDDVPENITVLAGILRGQYRVVFATRGADALTIVRDQKVDLILLDVMMPEMDGYEVCRLLKADLATRDIPVIFITALTEAGDEARGLRIGAADYLHKSSHASIVRLRVQMHIERYNQNLALERRVKERTQELDDSRREILRRLGMAAEYRDNETGLHIIRMAKSAHLLALAAGISASHADLILTAAPLHDVGKIGIPDQILLKPGPLEEKEWEVMKTHASIGAVIIGDHNSELLSMAKVIALTHHEKWDGSGYPRGFAGEAIPLEGRIVAIADVFDALTNERPYKRAWAVSEAVQYLSTQSGKSFDPTLLDLFLGLVPQIEQIGTHFSDTSSTPSALT
jgi:putative two-component system response regulator